MDDVKDSGIVGFSETEEFQKSYLEAVSEVEDLKSKIESLLEEKDSLEDELSSANTEIENLEERVTNLLETNDPDTVKSNLLDDITIRLGRDGLLTSELEEWFDNYCRFYINNV